MTVISEDSPYCGQSGRVRRIFWCDRRAWVVVRFGIGGIAAVPWDWTDLLIPQLGADPSIDEPAVLLSPTALCDLVRFVRDHHELHGSLLRAWIPAVLKLRMLPERWTYSPIQAICGSVKQPRLPFMRELIPEV